MKRLQTSKWDAHPSVIPGFSMGQDLMCMGGCFASAVPKARCSSSTANGLMSSSSSPSSS